MPSTAPSADPVSSSPASVPITAGVVTALVGFTSTFVVVLAGLRAVGASDAQAGSGLIALTVATGLACIILSLRFRLPITAAWSTPGAALLLSAGAVEGGFPAAVGAFLLTGVLIVITGLWPALGTLVAKIPVSIAQAMLAGVLMPLCLAPVTAVSTVGWLIVPTLIAWLLVTVWAPRWAVPAALVVALGSIGVYLAVTGTEFFLDRWWPAVEFVAPSISWQAVVSLALPLYIVTMASQNVPGVAVLKSFGYEAPWRASLAVTGTGTVASALFGGHAVNLAAISAALAAGPEAGPDRGRRWIAGISAGVSYITIALFSTLLVAIVIVAPAGMIEAVAGLALLGAMAGALKSALAADQDRIACLVAFLVAASGVAFGGISSAFWALLVGLLLRFALWPRERARD